MFLLIASRRHVRCPLRKDIWILCLRPGDGDWGVGSHERGSAPERHVSPSVGFVNVMSPLVGFVEPIRNSPPDVRTENRGQKKAKRTRPTSISACATIFSTTPGGAPLFPRVPLFPKFRYLNRSPPSCPGCPERSYNTVPQAATNFLLVIFLYAVFCHCALVDKCTDNRTSFSKSVHSNPIFCSPCSLKMTIWLKSFLHYNFFLKLLFAFGKIKSSF